MEYKKLVIPMHLQIGIQPMIKGLQSNIVVIGADTETITETGKPVSFQFYSKDIVLDKLIFTNEHTAVYAFLDFCDRLPQNNSQYIIYCHNLGFDLIEFFYNVYTEFKEEEFKFEIDKWKISGIYASVVFCFMKHKNRHKNITIIDTAAFFKTSLAKLAEIICPDIPKLRKPKLLGKQFTISDKTMCNYAMRDAEIAYHVGKSITDMHDKFDVKHSVSIAGFASRIFKRKFLFDTIPQLPDAMMGGAILSYHGGKNNLTVKEGLYKNVRVYDITSSYPNSMCKLPSFIHSSLYMVYKCSGHPENQLPPFGIYKIKGFIKESKYPIAYSHGFKPIYGNVKSLWLTGVEINQLMRYKEVQLKTVYGYYYDAENELEKQTYKPLKDYVDYFYKEKEREKDPIYRYFWKTILNSLYGKFVETRKKDVRYEIDEDGNFNDISELKAGGMFMPIIAGLITALSREHITDLERKYKSLHTATDSIVTRMKAKESKGLGGLVLEHEGHIYIKRNKTYIIYSEKKSKAKKDSNGKPMKSKLYPKWYIVKYATHGYFGTVYDLEHHIKTGEREYKHTKVNKLKESLLRGLPVNAFMERKKKIHG